MKEDENKQEPEAVGIDPVPGKAPESAPESAAESAPESAAESAPQSRKGTPATKKVKPPVAPRQGSNGVAWLAVLIALGALGLAGWMWLGAAEGEKRLQNLNREAAANRQSVQQVQQQSTEMRRQLESELARQVGELRQQREQQFNTMQAALQSQRQQLLELRSTDRADWLLAEVEYLLRLAHQRLLLADDVRSALALLYSADAIVAELDDPDLHALRAAIASDAAALRAIPEVDVEGIWLRLRALSGEVDALLLFELPEPEVPETGKPTDADWQQRLEQGFRSGLRRLAGYIVIKRRDTAYQPLMDPQWERLVRQNLRMLLAQSQSALLSGNSNLYQQSLVSTRRWLAEFFTLAETPVVALDQELAALLAVDVSRDYPGVSDSVSAVKAALKERHAAPGGG